MPSTGLDMSRKATATELANLFKVLPVALLRVPSLFATFGEVMQGETDLCTFLTKAGHRNLIYVSNEAVYCATYCR